jgi:hypothetical protein
VGFGVKLRFRDKDMLGYAENEDKRARLIREYGTNVNKEDVTLPTCFGAVAIGKTAFVQNGLDACKQYCSDAELKDLLEEKNHPLGLMISFNATTNITDEELLKGNMGLSASRRLLAEYFSLSMAEADQIPLADTYRVTDCLRVIATDHRELHSMAADSKLFVYVAVDDVNQLVIDAPPELKGDRQRYRVKYLKQLSQALQAVAWGGVMNCFVSVMLAGTNYYDMKDSFIGSGVKPFSLHLQSLTSEELNEIMVEDAKVDARYIESGEFQTLVATTGSSLRALGEGVSGLKYKFQKSSIKVAAAKVESYFNMSGVYLNDAEVLRLHALVVTGHLVFARNKLFPDSGHTLENLEVNGFLKLCRSADKDEWVTVDVPEVFLHSWSKQITPTC